MLSNVEKQQLKVPAHIDYLGDLRDFVTQIGRKHKFSDKVVNAFKLSVDEAATNIIRHAYRDREGLITIRAFVRKNSLTISIIDQGKYFDPNRVENPDLNRYIDIGKKGGLGIFIMRKLMDEIDYRKTEEGNELRITKYYDQPAKKGLFQTAVSSIPFSIKAKYFFRAISIIFFIVTVTYLYFFFKTESEILTRFIASSQATNSQIVGLISSVEAEDIQFLDEFIGSIEEENRGLLWVTVQEKASDVITYSTDKALFGAQFTRPENVERISNNIYKYDKDGTTFYEFESPIIIRSSGELYGTANILFSAEPAKQQIRESRLDNLKVAALVLILSCGGVALLIYLIMNPFRKLSDWIKNLGSGDIDDEMDIDESSDLGVIAKAVKDMSNDLRESQVSLAQQERLQREMRVAKDIQQTLLPMEFPVLEGYQIAAHYDSATEVGGDYYDFVEVDKDTLGIAVADVSGKGVPGSLVMTMIRTALRTEARGVKDAAEVLARVNEFVSNDIKKGMFVTVFYLIIDSKRRSLNYASAGHNPMILRRSSKDKTYYLNPRGFPIGVKLPEKDYFRNYIESETIRLTKDDILLIYTDGITEAMNSARELYGEERLQQVMREAGGVSAEEFVEKLKDSIYEFTEGQPQNDDITLVAVKEESTREEDELRRAKEVHSLIARGMTVKDACEEASITTTAYYNKYRKIFEEQGVEAVEVDEDSSVEARHLSIEEKTKIFDVITRHPEFGASRIQAELNTERYGFTEISERKIYDELVRNRLNTRPLREAYINRARRGKRRPKPPGTPVLTLDGEIILRKSEMTDFVLPEKEEEVKDAELVKPRDARKSGDSTSESEKESSDEPSFESLADHGSEGGDDTVISEFESDVFIDGSIDEILYEDDAIDQDKADLTEDNSDDSFYETSEDASDTVDDTSQELSKAGNDDDEFEGLDDSDSSLLTDFSVDELFASGGQQHEGDDDFDDDFDDESETTVDQQLSESDPAADDVHDEAEREEETEPSLSDDDFSEEFDVQTDEVAYSGSEQDATHDITIADDDKSYIISEAEQEEDDDRENGVGANEFNTLEGDDTVSFSDLIQSLDDEIVYVTRPPHLADDPDEQDAYQAEFEEEADGDDSFGAAENEDNQTPADHTAGQNGGHQLDKETILISGIKYYKNNEYDRAIEEFKRAIHAYPDYKEAHSILGNAYFRTRQYDMAAREYERVKEIDPNDITAYENMGVIYANRGEYKQALREWKKVMELNPERIDIKDKIKKALRMIT